MMVFSDFAATPVETTVNGGREIVLGESEGRTKRNGIIHRGE
jgi:hypothetical protein